MTLFKVFFTIQVSLRNKEKEVKKGKRSSKRLCFQGRKGSSACGRDTVYIVQMQYLIPLTKKQVFPQETAQYNSRQYYPPYSNSHRLCVGKSRMYMYVFVLKASCE